MGTSTFGNETHFIDSHKENFVLEQTLNASWCMGAHTSHVRFYPKDTLSNAR